MHYITKLFFTYCIRTISQTDGRKDGWAKSPVEVINSHPPPLSKKTPAAAIIGTQWPLMAFWAMATTPEWEKGRLNCTASNLHKQCSYIAAGTWWPLMAASDLCMATMPEWEKGRLNSLQQNSSLQFFASTGLQFSTLWYYLIQLICKIGRI